ncbi:MAG TPA: ABC transporter permease, partial [Bryobacteraceae bacterium]
MNWLRFFRRARKDAESAADLQFYLDTETEDNIARGLHPQEARLAARRKLGNPTFIREEIWRRNSIGFLETVWQDLRYALRTMRKSPAFTLTAVLILAVAIGGNTTMFTVINGVLLKPLSFRESGQLVRVFLGNPKQPHYDTALSLLRLEEVKASAKSFSGIGAFLKFKQNMALAGRGEPEALQDARVSANFLDILGVTPLLGRGFLPQEGSPKGPSVALISAGLWRRKFGTDPQVAGKTATLNSTVYTIIGVLPDSFTFPFTGTDVWVTKPEEWSVVPSRFWPYVNSLNGIARLKPGISLRQAQAELDVLNRQYSLAHPETNPERAGAATRIIPLKDHLVSSIRPTLLMLFGAVVFVLLIACANVAGLLLARANVRSREFAVRAAMGASRGRLVHQLLAESLVLAGIGGVLGILLAKWALSAIKRFTAINLPRTGDIRLDWTVLGFTLAV